MAENKWTWPDYQEFTDRIDEFTGAKADPANKTLGDIMEDAAREEQKPCSAEEQQRIEEESRKAKERARRRVTDYDLYRFLVTRLSRVWRFRRLAMPEEELEWWERRIGVGP